jgi:hypothetical protein
MLSDYYSNEIDNPSLIALRLAADLRRFSDGRQRSSTSVLDESCDQSACLNALTVTRWLLGIKLRLFYAQAGLIT